MEGKEVEMGSCRKEGESSSRDSETPDDLTQVAWAPLARSLAVKSDSIATKKKKKKREGIRRKEPKLPREALNSGEVS